MYQLEMNNDTFCPMPTINLAAPAKDSGAIGLSLFGYSQHSILSITRYFTLHYQVSLNLSANLAMTKSPEKGQSESAAHGF